MFSLPSGFLASTTNIISQIFLDLKGLIILGFGLAVGFWIIAKIIVILKEGIGK